jgi:hypothetical protein
MGDGRVTFWSSSQPDNSGTGGDQTHTATHRDDPATGEMSGNLVSNIKHDMFCPGLPIAHQHEADGR